MLKPEEHDLDSYLTHFEIIQLWASPKYDHVDVAQYEKLIWQAVTDGDLLAEVSIRNPKALGGFEVIPYSPTTLRQARDGVLGKSFVQFTIHRDKFREWFVKSNQCPLVDDCLLAKWFETETVPNAGAGNDDTEPKDKELTAWLRATWINEGKLGGTAFFNKLKKYANQKGSPITEHYSAGKVAGIKWETSAGTTGEMKKKTIQTKVSTFKNTS